LSPGIDGKFVALAQALPGFGGYYYDDDGNLNVWMTYAADEILLRSVLSDFVRASPTDFAASDRMEYSPIIIHRGEFDFPQLDEWRTRIGAHHIAGMLRLDTDEIKNRIVVGVADISFADTVEELLEKLAIPRQAVEIDVVEPIELATDIRQLVRPVVGGVRIDFGTSFCSLGVNAYYSHSPQVPNLTHGFFTASHCGQRGVIDGTVFYQGEQRIGAEMWEPPFFTPSDDFRCAYDPAPLKCRWSDVTFAKYDAGADRQQGHIAQTTSRGITTAAGSFDINPASPTFSIAQIIGDPVAGTWLDKVGARTGWNTGKVIRTCEDEWSEQYTILYLCQDVIDMYTNTGDSGAPVFKRTGSTTGAWAGIVWGTVVLKNETYFSPLGGIYGDFGSSISQAP
jgi:hypothetical protein